MVLLASGEVELTVVPEEAARRACKSDPEVATKTVDVGSVVFRHVVDWKTLGVVYQICRVLTSRPAIAAMVLSCVLTTVGVIGGIFYEGGCSTKSRDPIGIAQYFITILAIGLSSFQIRKTLQLGAKIDLTEPITKDTPLHFVIQRKHRLAIIVVTVLATLLSFAGGSVAPRFWWENAEDPDRLLTSPCGSTTTTPWWIWLRAAGCTILYPLGYPQIFLVLVIFAIDNWCLVASINSMNDSLPNPFKENGSERRLLQVSGSLDAVKVVELLQGLTMPFSRRWSLFFVVCVGIVVLEFLATFLPFIIASDTNKASDTSTTDTSNASKTSNDPNTNNTLWEVVIIILGITLANVLIIGPPAYVNVRLEGLLTALLRPGSIVADNMTPFFLSWLQAQKVVHGDVLLKLGGVAPTVGLVVQVLTTGVTTAVIAAIKQIVTETV